MAMRDSTVPKKTRYEHVVVNEDRVPEIAGTRLKVVELVIEQQAYGVRRSFTSSILT
jgi:hypothetical protein